MYTPFEISTDMLTELNKKLIEDNKLIKDNKLISSSYYEQMLSQSITKVDEVSPDLLSLKFDEEDMPELGDMKLIGSGKFGYIFTYGKSEKKTLKTNQCKEGEERKCDEELLREILLFQINCLRDHKRCDKAVNH